MKTMYTTMLMTCLVLAGQAQDPSFEWVKPVGGAITTDANGNIYLTGGFTGTVDFDPGMGVEELTSLGSYDIFIQKLDATGEFLWIKQMGGINTDVANSIALDADGNIYTIGEFKETVDFDPGTGVANFTSLGSYDMFIQKLDANGNFIWAKQMEGTDSDDVRGITIDSGGNLYTTGSFRGTVDFDPGLGVQNFTALGSRDMFIQKLDANGNFIWAKQMADPYGYGSLYTISGNAITTDTDGNVYTTGAFNGLVDFDPGPGEQVFSSEFNDIFIQKLDINGDLVWAKSFGSLGNDYGTSIVTDTNGNVYTTGSYGGYPYLDVIDFDPGPGTSISVSIGGDDAFVHKLSSNGTFMGVRTIAGSGNDKANSIAIDDNDDIYITGYVADEALFSTFGSVGIFIQKLNSNLVPLWTKQIGGSGADRGYHITTDACGNIYTVGSFEETVDFDPGPDVQNLTATGNASSFIHKFNQFTTGGTDVLTSCNAYTWIDGNTYTENNNTATFVIPQGAADGCDSLITLDLTINNVSDITTSVNNSTITANNSNATYQWLDCDDNYTPIPNETNQNFTPTINGNYAVELTENGCTEISDCVSITTVSLSENPLKDKFIVYPNPTDGAFAIEFDKIQQNLTVRLFSALGQLLENKNFQNTQLIQLKIDYPNGIYILELLDDNGNRTTLKLLKNDSD